MQAATLPAKPLSMPATPPRRLPWAGPRRALTSLPGGLLFLLALLWCPPLSAADLIEPWDSGFSDMELYASRAGDSSGTDFASVLGYGLAPGFSVGAALSTDDDGSTRLGLVAFYSRRLGGGLEMDFFAETGVHRAEEAELDGEGDWLAGFEWSLHRAAVIPYLRTSVYDAPDGNGFHPLLGLMVPAGEKVDLHFEVSSESPQRGSWPLHVAIGPNVQVTETIEILPEISMIREREDGETHWQFSIGLVMDPRSLSIRKPR